jgi:hypothetical protein
MAKLSDAKIQFLLTYYQRLVEREWLFDICSALGRHPIHTAYPMRNMHWNFEKDNAYTNGDIVVIGNDQQTVVAYVVGETEMGDKKYVNCDYLCEFEEVKMRPIFDAIDTFKLPAGFMHNKEALETTFGRFLFNYMVWFQHGVDIEYNNEPQKSSNVSGLLPKLLLAKSIDPTTARKVINSLFYLASFTALFVPTLTEKSMMNSPEVMKRKQELIKEYGDKLTDPLVAKEFEQELIAMDKKFLEGDKSKRFLDAQPSKTYEIHRKKMFISIGGIPAFDAGSNKYTFIPNSLSEGWTIEAFPDICNEIRKGAYDRGKETAKGGEQTKFLLRVFQDVRITEEDCGSVHGLPMEFDEKSIGSYMGQYIVTNKGPVEITPESAPQFIGKKVIMRSPMFCKTKNGRCAKCVGEMFRTLNMEAIGMTVLKVGSRFTTLSMKNMHGTVITTQTVDPFNFVINKE